MRAAPGGAARPGGPEMTATTTLDPFRPEAMRDPYPVHAALRERGVVHLEHIDTWVASRFADVEAILLDTARFSSRNVGGGSTGRARDPELAAIQREGLATVAVLTPADPPRHRWYRQAVSKPFSPRSIAELSDSIERIVAGLIDGFADRGRADLVAELARPFPLLVFAELAGVPTDDIDLVKQLTDDHVEMIAAAVGQVPRDRQLHLARQNVAFQRYVVDLVDARRADSGEDLLTHLIDARLSGFDGRPLDDAELMSMVMTILDGGNETTINLVANGLALLLEHPDQLQALRDDPSLVPGAVEEILRYEAPVQCLFRQATVDVELGGATIPAGARVALLYGAANRDPERFDDPDTFDVRRPDAHRALHFGKGEHFCLGAHLARLEGRIAFEQLLARLPGLRPAGDQLVIEHHPNPVLRGVAALDVAWDPPSA